MIAHLRPGLAAVLAAAVLLACSAEPVEPPVEAPDTASDAAAPLTPAEPVPTPASPDALVPAPTPPITSVPESRPALEAAVARILADASDVAAELQLRVLVVDEAGREVAAIEPDRPTLPASTLKLVTAAAVLTTLGPDARLTTVVDATAGIDGTGVLDGDLVLIGSGDPTLATDEYGAFVYPARPRTRLAALADDLVAAGLTRVTGGVRGVSPGFTGEPLPSGWRDAYLASFDGRYASGLTVDAGLRTLVEYPEADEDVQHDLDGVVVTTEPLDQTPQDPPLRSDDQPEVPPTIRIELAIDPALHAAAELTRLLEERDVEVVARPTTEPPERPLVARLARVSSATVADLLTFTVQRSDNHLADHLFQVIGRVRTGEGSWERGGRALTQVLDRFGVDREGAVFADGSGLSRDDRVTPRLLVELDLALTSSPRFSAPWRSFHAVAGRSGTLRTRLVGTPAVGRFLGKTGSLRDVTAVSGQVLAADADASGPARPGERRYHVAVLANDADGDERGVTRAVMDEIVLALTADLDGCRIGAVGDVDGPLGRPPSGVICGD